MNRDEILGQADTCVKCGLCLPHCPTYAKTLDEAESPRGRIALVQGLLSGLLEETQALHAHLDRCLECRACEMGCPSGVPVTRIIDAARESRSRRLPLARRFTQRLLLGVALRPRLLTASMRALRRLGPLGRSPGLGSLVQRASHLLPPGHPSAVPGSTAGAEGPERGHLVLFPGCVGRVLDRSALEAASRVLRWMGYRVTIPAENLCCGALHRHEGYPEQANRRRAASADHFLQGDYQALLGVASACVGELALDPRLTGKIHEVSRFLVDAPWPETPLRPAGPERIAVHLPCTQTNLLKDRTAPFRLLERIPGLALTPLPEGMCCGAAGAYLLREPRMSRALEDDRTAEIAAVAPDLIVTTNTGCAVQLAAGIRSAGLNLAVLHPVELIARHLPKPLPPA